MSLNDGICGMPYVRREDGSTQLTSEPSLQDANFLLAATPEELAKLRNQLKMMERTLRNVLDSMNEIERRMKKKLAKEGEYNT